MSKEIELKKGEFKKTIQDLENKTAELSNLQMKRNELSHLNSGKEASGIDAAVTHRKEVLAAFVTGRASQADLDQATNAIEEMEGEAKLSEEMSEAIDSAILKNEAEIQKNKTAIDMAKRRLFESIYDELKKEIQNTIGNRVNCAIAVRTRYGVSCMDTLVNLFGGGSIPVIDEAAKALESEFGIEF